MARFASNTYTVGEWSIGTRGESPMLYRWRYDPTTGKVSRVSLGTTDFEEAKRRLDAWWLANRTVKDEKPADASLADILRRYWEEHAKDLASASSAKDCLNRWLDYWGDQPVSALQDIRQQEAFHAWMRSKDYTASSMMRVINTGKAAINRAHKRGELTTAPYVMSVPVGSTNPKGRPLTVDELRLVYGNAVPHIQAFMRWAVGTGARPEAILELQARQIDWEQGLVDLNPPGRKQQPKKYRPVVRLPEALRQPFEGYAVAYQGQRVQSVKKGLWRACDRAGVERCSSYSFRHTAARWMRREGVPPWEVAAQLGHSVGSKFAVSERYAAYSPDYLQNAVLALNKLVLAAEYLPNTCQKLVPQEGFEPPTPSLRMMCSTN